jgi:uncharacterized protein YwgA
MNQERFRWLAGVIAAHPKREVHGRTRLQKTIKLLQRLDLPTDYSYTIHFYGPYSEGLQAEIGLLEAFGLVSEEIRQAQDRTPYYVLCAAPEAAMPAQIEPFQPAIDTMNAATSVVLELAATYDSFREMGSDHQEALVRLRRKKGSKCDGGNEDEAMELLSSLGLDVE